MCAARDPPLLAVRNTSHPQLHCTAPFLYWKENIIFQHASADRFDPCKSVDSQASGSLQSDPARCISSVSHCSKCYFPHGGRKSPILRIAGTTKYIPFPIVYTVEPSFGILWMYLQKLQF